MSIASLGIIGGLASSATAQRAAETERIDRDATNHARQSESVEKAEDSAGIGRTEEDSQTSERDADGRRLWERPGSSKKSSESDAVATVPVISKDPTGLCGGQLDLVG